MKMQSSGAFLPWALVLLGCTPPPSGGDGDGTEDGGTMLDGSFGEAGSGTTSGGRDASEAETSAVSGSDTGVVFECPEAGWYEGDLTVDASTDLDALRDVGGVAGSLFVYQSTVADLEFLSCLEIVEGAIQISDNPDLASLDGLERLHSVLGEVRSPMDVQLLIANNPSLTTVDSLEALEEIGVLVIRSNGALTEISLDALRDVETLVLGQYCPEAVLLDQPLDAVGEYGSLEHIGELRVHGQLGFTSLASLTAMVEGGLVVDAATFMHNFNLPEIEIDTFAAAASLTPETCWNGGGEEECECPIE